MDTSIKEYHRLLAIIDSELRADNIKSLKFLCESNLGPKKSAVNFSNGFELFDALEKNGKLSEDKRFYLCELLHIIGRVDLGTQFDNNFVFDRRQCTHVDSFRVMLYRLSEDLASEDVSRLRFLYNNVPRSVNIVDGLDLFLIMLQHKAVSPTNLILLEQLVKEIDRHDLCPMISSFNQERQELGYSWHYELNDLGHQELVNITEVTPELESTYYENNDSTGVLLSELSISGEGEPMDLGQTLDDKLLSSPTNNAWPNCDQPSFEGCFNGNKLTNISDEQSYKSNHLNITVSTLSAQAFNIPADFDETAAAASGVTSMGSMTEDESYIPLAYYKMDAVPRGICVIIDNQDFTPDPRDKEAVQNLLKREGSDVDSMALRTSFQRLHFIIEERINLKDTEIINVLKEISLRNHEEYDCFVCCILSHGGDNHIYGVNGRKVWLGDITSMFRAQSCSTLIRKPKLFFMASCRGRNHQIATQNIPLFETDKPEIYFESAEWVPNESDFLFGYATVANHVSYRSRTQGTFYITELTKVLDKYAHREDLQTLLVRVNDAVSDRIYSKQEETGHVVYKQTPAPQHTLRKQLKFL